VGGFYSTNKQYKLSVNPVIYLKEDKLYISAPFSFGHFVDKFWGIGNSSIETGNEEYTTDVFTASLTVQIPPIGFAADRTGIIFDYNNTKIDDKRDNEYLNENSVIGSNGGTVFGIGTDLVWDSRDNLFFPNKGIYQYFKIVVYPGIGDHVFSLFELDQKYYLSFSPDHVLATNFYIADAQGDVPFYMLPALGGGNRMRGYFKGRYRDKFYSMLQVEYRQYFWRRFGFVVFAGLGDVAPEMTKLQFKELKYSLGVGLRYLFNKEEKVNLRVDIAFGKNGDRGIYFGIEEAF
jgi:outer membrane protein assembly factor BamA